MFEHSQLRGWCRRDTLRRSLAHARVRPDPHRTLTTHLCGISAAHQMCGVRGTRAPCIHVRTTNGPQNNPTLRRTSPYGRVGVGVCAHRCRTRHTRILKQIGVCQDAAARLRKSLRKSPWKTGPQAGLSRCQQPMETDAFRRNSRTSTKLSRSSTSGRIPFGWSFSISPTDTLTHCSTSGYSAVSAPGSAKRAHCRKRQWTAPSPPSCVFRSLR